MDMSHIGNMSIDDTIVYSIGRTLKNTVILSSCALTDTSTFPTRE